MADRRGPSSVMEHFFASIIFLANLVRSFRFYNEPFQWIVLYTYLSSLSGLLLIRFLASVIGCVHFVLSRFSIRSSDD
jgi:hypothetical protein